jgi:hypothetical protein
MMNKDNQNEGIGIAAIIIIILLAAIGLYYFFSHRPPTALNVEGNPNVPLEVPAPIKDHSGNSASLSNYLQKNTLT